MTFLARLTELIKNNKDHHWDKHAKLSAYLVNHAEAIRDLVLAAELLHDNLAEYQRINNIGGYDNQDMRMVREALAKLEES